MNPGTQAGIYPLDSSLHKQPFGSSVQDLLPKLETRLQGPKGFVGLPVRPVPGPGWEIQKAPYSSMPPLLQHLDMEKTVIQPLLGPQ